MKGIFLTGLFFLTAGRGMAVPEPEEPVVLHTRGAEGCHTTRIPGLARTGKGTLLAVFDLRYDSAKDLQGHMDIGLRRSVDGGRTWSPVRPVMDMGEYGGRPQAENGCSDPNILVDAATGEIFVTALWVHGKPGTHQWKGRGSEPGFEIGVTAQFMMVRSTDDGLTWSAPENLTQQLKRPEWWLFAPSPGSGVTLRDGTLVIPSQGRDGTGHPFSNLIWSRDHGKTWTVSTPARTDTTESTVAELSDGRLMLNMRDNRNRTLPAEKNGRAVSVTADRGRTWTVHPSDHHALPEPVCMGSLLAHRLPDGRQVLFFSNPRHLTKREQITVQASLDDGLTWPENRRVLIAAGPSYGYSCLAMVDDAVLGVLYESRDGSMSFRRVGLEAFGLGQAKTP